MTQTTTLVLSIPACLYWRNSGQNHLLKTTISSQFCETCILWTKFSSVQSSYNFSETFGSFTFGVITNHSCKVIHLQRKLCNKYTKNKTVSWLFLSFAKDVKYDLTSNFYTLDHLWKDYLYTHIRPFSVLLRWGWSWPTK